MRCLAYPHLRDARALVVPAAAQLEQVGAQVFAQQADYTAARHALVHHLPTTQSTSGPPVCGIIWMQLRLCRRVTGGGHKYTWGKYRVPIMSTARCQKCCANNAIEWLRVPCLVGVHFAAGGRRNAARKVREAREGAGCRSSHPPVACAHRRRRFHNLSHRMSVAKQEFRLLR